MAADDAGPLERAWLCCGFRVLIRDDWQVPEVYEAAGQVAVLVLPLLWARRPELREVACGFAMADVFLLRFGWRALVRVLLHLGDAVAFFAQQEGNAAD